MDQEIVHSGRVSKLDHLAMTVLSCVPLLSILFLMCVD